MKLPYVRNIQSTDHLIDCMQEDNKQVTLTLQSAYDTVLVSK